MSNRFTPVIIVLLILQVACSKLQQNDWYDIIPSDTPALILAPPGKSLQDLLNENYVNLLDEVSSSSILLFSTLDPLLTDRMQAKAILIYPNRTNDWQPVFISKGSADDLQKAATGYSRNFTENQYIFEGVTIYRMFLENRVIYGASLSDWIVLSESSYGIEESIRSFIGETQALELPGDDIPDGELILNLPYFDRLISQFAAVRYKPGIREMFRGTKPGDMSIRTETGGQMADQTLRINGIIPLNEQGRSNIIDAISYRNFRPVLDRYIPADAAVFGIFNSPASGLLNHDFEPATKLDSLLSQDPMLYASIAETISPEFAFAAFYTSGFNSENENAYIRSLSNTPELFRQMNRLASEGYLIRNNDGYYIRSRMMAVLLGSPFCHYDEFYLAETGQTAVISPRNGLAQRVRGDYNRRRVMHYDETYSAIRRNLAGEMSGFLYVNSDNFDNYISSMLAPNKNINSLTNRFDIATLTLQLNEHGSSLDFDMRTHQLEKSNEPFQDLWVYPLDDTELTGKPVFSDLTGNNRDEVVFATSNNDVVALATDGSIAFQARTGIDTPVGSPIVYDWYANNQKAVIMAAGNKIYAWNRQGALLPNFPFELPEQITAPVEIADLTRSGLPEIVIATADRQIHVLSGRGQNISGWPQSVNSTIQHKPVVAMIRGSWGIWATAENAVHAWEPNGTPRQNFPWFAESSLTGSPVFMNDALLTGSADGSIYAISNQMVFPDSLSELESSEIQDDDNPGTSSLTVQSIQIAGSPVTVAGFRNNVRLRNDDNEVITEAIFIVQSNNGSVFLYNQNGVLRFVKSTGQQASNNDLPFLTDLASNGWNELLAVTTPGRIYGWSLDDSEPLNTLPGAGMKYPVIQDLTGDGTKNFIAQTRDGLRCWRINL
jgi:hypothetical protein